MQNTLVIWPRNRKEATCPICSVNKEEKYGEKVKKAVSVPMLNAPRKRSSICKGLNNCALTERKKSI